LYVLDTTGSNLIETLALDFIDFRRTHINDIREIFDVLGIEAARQSIYNELNVVTGIPNWGTGGVPNAVDDVERLMPNAGDAALIAL
jgi:RNA polymerase Rpb1, domain 5